MQRKIFRTILVLLMLIPNVVLMTSTATCYANSAPPPSIFIIVSHAPKELKLSIGNVEPTREDKAFESYFSFYFWIDKPIDNYLRVNDGDSNYQISLPSLDSYTSIYTLNLNSKTLTTGTSLWIPLKNASFTVILTLLIEGIIFYLFKYRKKISWITFLLTNLITQGFLYILLMRLNYSSFHLIGDFLFTLLFVEFFVFLIEIVIFLIFLNEKPRLVALLATVLANLASLIAGGLLLNFLI